MILLLLVITYHSAFEIGFVPNDCMGVYQKGFWDKTAGNKVAGYFDIEIELRLRGFFIGGGVKTYVAKSLRNRIEFYPYQADYKFQTGYRFNDKIEIGWKHRCYHAVKPYITFGAPAIWGGGYDELFIRFEK